MNGTGIFVTYAHKLYHAIFMTYCGVKTVIPVLKINEKLACC